MTIGVADATAATDALGEAPAPVELQAARTSARAASTARMEPGSAGRRTDGDGADKGGNLNGGAIGGVAQGSHLGDANPSLRQVEGGVYPVECTVLPTFLSKVRACTVWPATGLPPEGGSP